MKKTFITFLLFIISFNIILSQNKNSGRAEELKTEMWNTPDKSFKVTDIPEKWKNESAVIISQYAAYEYKKSVMHKHLHDNQIYHRRIKLIDKAAIEEYSEMNVPDDEFLTAYYMGIKIIKPNGKESEVDLSKAVKIEQKAGRQSESYKKLAIPGLEPGDIFDYYLCFDQEIRLSDGESYTFDPITFPLASKYPILYQKIDFDVLRKCSIYIKSINGAPKFKADEDAKNDKKHFTLIDQNHEKEIAKHWFYIYRSVPLVKFQAHYPGESGVAKESFSEDLIKSTIGYHGVYYPEAYLMKWNKKNFKNEKDQLEQVKNSFYLFRNFHMSYVKGFKEYSLRSMVYGVYNWNSYLNNMENYLTKNKIPYKQCMALPRSISKLDDFIIEKEAYFFLRLTIKNKDYFIFPPVMHNNWDDIPDELQGVEYYYVDETPKGRQLKRSITPVVSADINKLVNKFDITFDKEKLTQFSITANVELSGSTRIDRQEEILIPQDYIDEESGIYCVRKPLYKLLNKKEMAELPEKKDARIAKRNKDVEELLKKEFIGDDNIKITSFSNFKVIQTGRMPNQPALKYSFDLKAEGFVKKVGQDYLIDIGKIITGQLALDKKDFEREYDVYKPYARSYNYEINLEIPNGYNLQGVEKLGSNVSNETGSFVSKAVLSGKILKINVNKVYNHNFEKAKDWPKLVSFIEVAYNFTQQKILLKKDN